MPGQNASTTKIPGSTVPILACGQWPMARAYMLRDGELRQITKEHSLVQELVDAGTIAAEDAENHPHANVITRAVGADIDELVLDKVSGRLQPGDRFLLCSDGLCKTVPFP